MQTRSLRLYIESTLLVLFSLQAFSMSSDALALPARMASFKKSLPALGDSLIAQRLQKESEEQAKLQILQTFPIYSGPEFETKSVANSGACKSVFLSVDETRAVYNFSLSDPGMAERYLQELFIFSKLSSVPTVIQSYGILSVPDQADEYQHILEPARYGSLSTFVQRGQIKQNSPLSIRSIVSVAHQLRTALMQIHSLGVIHRDIRPANILVTQLDLEYETIEIKLTDFDASYFFNGITTQGMKTRPFATTIAYSHPHQLKRSTEIIDRKIFSQDKRFDFWSAGMTVLNLIRGYLEPWQLVENDDERILEVGSVTQEMINLSIEEALKPLRAYFQSEADFLESFLSDTLQVDVVLPSESGAAG